MRRQCARIAAAATFAISFVGCSDGPNAPSTEGVSLELSLQPQLSKEAQEIAGRLGEFSLDIDEARIVVTRLPSTIVKDTVVPFPANASEITLRLTVPLVGIRDEFKAEAELRSGATPLFGGADQLTARRGALGPVARTIELTYIGPGRNATRLEVQPSNATITSSGSRVFTTAAYAADNSLVPGLPVVWSTGDPTMATISSAGLALPVAGKLGTVAIRARSLTGLTSSGTLRVIGLPGRFTLVGGSGQSGTVGAPLALPFTVQLLSTDDFGVPDARVTFRAVTSGGVVTSSTLTTDDQGRATARMTLGAAAGPYAFEVALAEPGSQVQPLSLSATALAGPPGAMTVLAGDGQSGSPGAALPQQLAVRVTDSFGNPISSATVNWTRVSGGGTLTAESSQTDISGRATIGYTLGTAAGPEVVRAQVAGLSEQRSFSLGVVPGPASQITLVSGDAQSGTAGDALGAALVVRALDSFGNAVAGAMVRWEILAGGGVLSTSSSPTDANGNAHASFTLSSTAGLGQVRAVLENANASVSFSLTALVGPPSAIAIFAGDAQHAVAGNALAQDLSVHVRDSHGNLVQGAGVSWSVLNGDATLGASQSSTDAGGLASVRVTTSRRAGPSTIVAAIANGPTTRFTVFGDPGPAAHVALLAGDDQTTVAGAPLPVPPTVLVTDANENVVPGATVSVTVDAPYVLVSGPTATTDAAGRAAFSNFAVSGPPGTAHCSFKASGTPTTDATVDLFVVSSLPASISAAPAVPLNGFGVVNSAVPSERLPAVVVRDANGVPAAGVHVGFTVSGGSIAPLGGGASSGSLTAVTDAAGIAAIGGWQLPVNPGQAAVTATVPGVPGSPVVFNILVTPAPTSLAKAGGDGQTGVVDATLAVSPTVSVRDAVGNPVPGIPVAFTIVAGGGSLSAGGALPGGVTQITDAAGHASVSWRLGTLAGPGTLVASATGMGSVSFSAMGVAGPASSIVLVSGDGQTAGAGSLLQPFVVRVADTFGNSVSGASVQWTRLSGSGTLGSANSSTNDGGVAQVGYTLGSQAGDETVRAELPGVAGASVLFTAHATTRALAGSIVLVDGDNQDGADGVTLARPLVAKVLDASGKPIAGSPVTWAVVFGTGKVAGHATEEFETTFTDANGLTQVPYEYGGAVGSTNVVFATATEAEPGTTPIVFFYSASLPQGSWFRWLGGAAAAPRDWLEPGNWRAPAGTDSRSPLPTDNVFIPQTANGAQISGAVSAAALELLGGLEVTTDGRLTVAPGALRIYITSALTNSGEIRAASCEKDPYVSPAGNPILDLNGQPTDCAATLFSTAAQRATATKLPAAAGFSPSRPVDGVRLRRPD